MRTVCVVASFSQQSGIGIYSLNLIKYLDNVVLFDWPFKTRWQRLVGPFKYFGKLKQIFKDNDTVHVQYHIGEYMFFFLPLLLFAGQKKTRLILTLHEQDSRFNFLIRWFHYIFYGVADCLIVHTQDHYDELPTFLKNKTVVIRMGVPEYPMKVVKVDKGVVLIPGFINKWKGHDFAIYVFKNCPTLKGRLKIVGKCNDVSFYMKLKKMALYNYNRIDIQEGFMDKEDYLDEIRKASVILLPYKEITGSAVFLDTIALEKPLIASNLPFFKEYLPDSMIFKSDADLASKLDEVLKDPSYCVDHIKWIKHQYSMRKIAKKTQELYESLHVGHVIIHVA